MLFFSHLLISHATLPFISMTSEGLAKPRRRRTLFLHFSWSICRTVRAFFRSLLAVRTSAAIWNTHTHTAAHSWSTVHYFKTLIWDTDSENTATVLLLLLISFCLLTTGDDPPDSQEFNHIHTVVGHSRDQRDMEMTMKTIWRSLVVTWHQWSQSTWHQRTRKLFWLKISLCLFNVLLVKVKLILYKYIFWQRVEKQQQLVMSLKRRLPMGPGCFSVCSEPSLLLDTYFLSFVFTCVLFPS